MTEQKQEFAGTKPMSAIERALLAMGQRAQLLESACRLSDSKVVFVMSHICDGIGSSTCYQSNGAAVLAIDGIIAGLQDSLLRFRNGEVFEIRVARDFYEQHDGLLLARMTTIFTESNEFVAVELPAFSLTLANRDLVGTTVTFGTGPIVRASRLAALDAIVKVC